MSLRRIGRLFIPYRQETYLLHTTVRENLRYARPDATDAEIETGTHTSLLAEDGRYAALAA